MSLRDKPIATLDLDLRVENHDLIVINGTTYQLGEMPAWTERPRSQPPLWVSDDAARLVDWARGIEAGGPALGALSRGPRNAHEFNMGEAMDFLWGGPPSKDRTAKWEAVKDELWQKNLICEAGWSGYRLTSVALTFVTPRPAVRSLT